MLSLSLPGVDLEILVVDFESYFCGLFELVVLAQSSDPLIELKKLVGQTAVVEIEATAPSPAPAVQGIVREAEVVSVEPTGVSRYRLNIVPPLWLTTRRTNYRVFQNRTATEIVADILADYSFRIPEPTLHVSPDPKYECVTQYEETDYRFIRRILARSGIATYFDHSAESAWVLVTDTSASTTLHDPEMLYVEPGIDSTDYAVHGISSGGKLKTSVVTLGNYNAEDPNQKLQVVESAEATELYTDEGSLEEYAYEHVRLATEDAAKSRARARLEAERAAGRRFEVHGNFAIGSGTRITISGHPRPEHNGQFLVLRSAFRGTPTIPDSSGAFGLQTVTATLECIPAARKFTPRLLEPPRVAGIQMARVVCESPGPEIDVDAQGRVLIEYDWDRRRLGMNTSRRVRVAQAWAGPGYGLVCLPRVGDEVLVDYVAGDPDDPIIIGRVHSTVNTVPLNLPGESEQSVWKSRSSPKSSGFNRVLMDDKAGAERLELKAQRDYKREVGRNSVTEVTVDESIKVGGKSQTKVASSHSIQSGSTSISTGAYSLSAKNSTETVKDTVTVKAGNIIKHESVNHFVETSGFWAKVKSVFQINGPKFDAFCENVFLKGSASIKLEGGEITIKGTKITIDAGVVEIKGTPIKLN